MAQLQKMGVARNVGLGGQAAEVDGLGSIIMFVSLQNPFSFCSIVQSLHGQDLEQKQPAGARLGAPRSSRSTPRSQHRCCTSLKRLGRVSRCALVPGGHTRARPSEPWLFVAFVAQGLTSCFPAPLPSCPCELA